MADNAVFNIRGSGPGGWINVVAHPFGRKLRAQSVVDQFMAGASIRCIAHARSLPVSVVEDVIRWGLRRNSNG